MVSILSKLFSRMPANHRRPIWEDLSAMKAGELHIDEFRERALRNGYTEYGVKRLIARAFVDDVRAIGDRLEADIVEAVRSL
jgi:1,6-anhydro-N-acetylmuramate kinase